MALAEAVAYLGEAANLIPMFERRLGPIKFAPAFAGDHETLRQAKATLLEP